MWYYIIPQFNYAHEYSCNFMRTLFWILIYSKYMKDSFHTWKIQLILYIVRYKFKIESDPVEEKMLKRELLMIILFNGWLREMYLNVGKCRHRFLNPHSFKM